MAELPKTRVKRAKQPAASPTGRPLMTTEARLVGAFSGCPTRLRATHAVSGRSRRRRSGSSLADDLRCQVIAVDVPGHSDWAAANNLAYLTRRAVAAFLIDNAHVVKRWGYPHRTCLRLDGAYDETILKQVKGSGGRDARPT